MGRFLILTFILSFNMATQTITIDSILNGFSQTQYLSSSGAFGVSLGIDPDLPIDSSVSVKTSGAIVPAGYAEFGTDILGGENPLWFITQPKLSFFYVYTSGGKFIKIEDDISSTTLLSTITSSGGNGAVYYNNYIYLMSNTQVFRYGPLDGTPAMSNALIANSELLDGWDSTADTLLTNTTYPSVRVSIPNHAGHVHGDNALYFCDFKDGQGLIHKIQTTKTTSEGDTDDGSAYNVLDLPFGFKPVDIESWGTDLAILAVQQSSDSTFNEGKSALFLWDPTDTVSFYRGPIFLPDPVATALLNVNGSLRIFSGNAVSGVRVSKYIGGESISTRDEDSEFLEDSMPPLAGAVDAFGSRGVFGGFTTLPEGSACVYAIGSKKGKVPMGLHNVVRTTSANRVNEMATAVKFVQQSSNIEPKVIAGWRNNSDSGMDSYSSSATLSSLLRTKYYSIGRKFQIREIRIPFGKAVAANTEITVKVFLDDESSSKTLTTINNTNYPGARKVIYKEPELSDVIGENNFFIEVKYGGTVSLPITYPIIVVLDTFDNE